METTHATMLEVTGLRKSYGSFKAVDGLDFQVRHGEIFGLLGPNGAGKTTTIKMLCKVLKPDSGTITGIGSREKIGLCPQELIFWSNLSCLENLVFMAAMYDIPAKKAKARAVQILADLALSDKTQVQARKLSGGMQRRLNLALALIHDPQLVILDEPEAGLDPQSRVLVRDFIRSLARHKTVILTTHNMDEAYRLSDRLAIVDHGKLLACGSPDELIASNAHHSYQIEVYYPASQKSDPLVGEAHERLTQAGLAASVPEGLRMVIVGTNQEAELRQVTALLNGSCRPEDIRLRRTTLEDVFIQLTGRSIRQ